MRQSVSSRSLRALALLLLSSQSALASSLSSPRLLRRDEDYADEVCKPSTSADEPVPPCVSIENIEALCTPNGTEPLYIAAHAQCMCGGSYFAEWNACQDCLELHGQRSGRDEAFFLSVASSASQELCGFLTSSGAATPTAPFASLFSEIANTLAQPTTGATVSSDRAVSKTAVSLYYTASGSQGPGKITGSETAATATGGLVTESQSVTTTATGGSATGTASDVGSTASSASASSASSTTTAAGNGAAPAGVGSNLLAGVVGLAIAGAMY